MLGRSKFVRVLVIGSLLTASVAVANGATSILGSKACETSTELNTAKAGDVFFDNGSSKLNKNGIKALKKIASSQNKSEVVKIEITGYVSAVGPSSAHKSLSQARALAVKKYLASQGFKTEFVTRGVGVTSSKSTAASARKATVKVVTKKSVNPTSKVPVTRSEIGTTISLVVGTAVNLNTITLDAATKADTKNPTTLSISPDLPQGLSMDNKTGVITGTPTAQKVPTKYTITAKNACGSSSIELEISIGNNFSYIYGETPTDKCPDGTLKSTNPSCGNDGNNAERLRICHTGETGGSPGSWYDPTTIPAGNTDPDVKWMNYGCDYLKGQGGPTYSPKSNGPFDGSVTIDTPQGSTTTCKSSSGNSTGSDRNSGCSGQAVAGGNSNSTSSTPTK